MWPIIARREFVERVRDRGFQVSTAITLVLLTGVIVISAAFNRPTSFDLAVVGEGSDALGAQVRVAAAALGVEVVVHELADEAEARRAVDAGESDAALVDAAEILVRADPPDQLVGLIQVVSVRERSRRALITAGLTPEEVDAALVQEGLPVHALEPVDARSRETATVVFVGVLLLYGQLFAYGYWVASGVVEEKSSRVVEVLLATVRPSHLLRGKILGIGLLGLGQLLLIGLVGLFASSAVGSLDFPSGAVATIGLVLGWFILGFFFYASLVRGRGVDRHAAGGSPDDDDAAHDPDPGLVLHRADRDEQPGLDAGDRRVAPAVLLPARDADQDRPGGGGHVGGGRLGRDLGGRDRGGDPDRDDDLLPRAAAARSCSDPTGATTRRRVSGAQSSSRGTMQNSFPSGSAITRQRYPPGISRMSETAEPPSATICAKAPSRSSTARSTWSRFLTDLASGTRWNATGGAPPSVVSIR
jgi:hypothetical protein